MGTTEQATPVFARADLADLPRVSDPSTSLYAAFGLTRATLSQVAGPSVWLRTAVAVVKGHVPGGVVGDALQMPGVFLVQNGRAIRAFRHEHASDAPDYVDMATCPLPPR